MAAVALEIITLLEQMEPEIQADVIELINLWSTNAASVKTVLQGEVTDLQTIINNARAAQGLPQGTQAVDPDPNAPPATT